MYTSSLERVVKTEDKYGSKHCSGSEHNKALPEQWSSAILPGLETDGQPAMCENDVTA